MKKINTLFMILLLLSAFEFVYEPPSSKLIDQDPLVETEKQIEKRPIIRKELKPGKIKRIATYESFQTRDRALNQIKPEKISYIFDYIPSVTLVDSGPDDVPLEGLVSVAEANTVTKASSVEQVNLDDIYSEGFTLRETAEILGINEIRSEYGLTGEGVRIAILDSGVSDTTLAFDDRVSYNAVEDLASKGVVDQDGHGTHVTGIAASNGMYYINNEWVQTDSMGMAPGSHIESIRVLDETGSGDNDWILQGLELAISKSVDIISLSLSTAVYEGEDDPMAKMIKTAVDAGIVVVAAAGNTGPIGSAIGIPAALPDVISVGASVPRGEREQRVWDFSGVGPAINGYPGPDFIAPGSNILSVNNTNGQVAVLSGTSMAAPHISGGIALLKEAFPNATVEHIREALLSATSLSTSAEGRIEQVEAQGRGYIRFDVAYDILNDSLVNNPDTHTNMAVIPNWINEWNYVYRNRIINHTKVLPFFIHSSRPIVVQPFIDKNSRGVEIVLPSQISLSPGINRIEIGIKINTTINDFVEGRIYFRENETAPILHNSNITILTESVPLNGRILFDISHDQDTKSSYFANHSPFGQYSQMSRLLENQGYFVNHSNNQTITTDLLDQYDLLVIANPDKDYSEGEISAIHDFTRSQGKSILLLVNGGIFDVEGSPTYSAFNFLSVNSILEGSGINIPENSTSVSCPFDQYTSVEDRDEFCVQSAFMLLNQNVYQTTYQYPHFGPNLKLADSLPNNVENLINLASLNQHSIAAAAEFTSKGRLLVFSSTLPFDNEGILYDYIAGESPDTNRAIMFETINWLLSPRRITMNYNYQGQIVDEITVNMHQPFTVTFQPKDKEGNLLNLGENVSLRMRIFDFEEGTSSYDNYFAQKDGDNFVISATFTRQIQVDFYLPLNVSDNIPTNGHFRITASLSNYEQQGTFRIVGRLLFVLLVVSWIFWFSNEGGREAKNRRKVFDED